MREVSPATLWGNFLIRREKKMEEDKKVSVIVRYEMPESEVESFLEGREYRESVELSDNSTIDQFIDSRKNLKVRQIRFGPGEVNPHEDIMGELEKAIRQAFGIPRGVL
jgi:hypothetical protein